VVAGLVLVAVIAAAIAVHGAFRQQQEQPGRGAGPGREPGPAAPVLADWSP
jgi:hypothetical protein